MPLPQHHQERGVPLVDRLRDEGIGFDLDEQRGLDEPGHLDHGCGWPDAAEHLAVRLSDLLPPADVGDVHAGPYDVLQLGASLLQRVLYAAQRLAGLLADVAFAERPAVGCRGGGAGHETKGPTRTARE